MEVKFYSTDGRELLLGFGNSGLLATVKETGTPYHGGLTAQAEGQNSGNGSECDCNCMMQPYYVARHEVSIGWHLDDGRTFSEISEYFHIQDMFPPDSCPDQKGIVFFEDAIAYCTFHSQDGWIIVAISEPEMMHLD